MTVRPPSGYGRRYSVVRKPSYGWVRPRLWVESIPHRPKWPVDWR